MTKDEKVKEKQIQSSRYSKDAERVQLKKKIKSLRAELNSEYISKARKTEIEKNIAFYGYKLEFLKRELKGLRAGLYNIGNNKKRIKNSKNINIKY